MVEEHAYEFLVCKKKRVNFLHFIRYKISCSDNGNKIIKRLKDKVKLFDNYGIIKNVIINNNLSLGCVV